MTRALSISMTPRLIKRPAVAVAIAPLAIAPPAPAVDIWLGQLYPRPPIYAVGRLRRQNGSRGLLIHVVQLDATTLEVRYRLSEPDGPFVIVGTLCNGAGRLNLNADDESNPLHVWAVLSERKRHEGWNLFRAEGARG